MPKKISKKPQTGEYTNIKLPNDMIDMIDRLIGKHGFKSRGEIVKDALRDFLQKYPVPIEPKLPRFEHFNIDEHGVRILDRELATTNSPNGRIIDVYFKPEGAFCDYHQSTQCAHIDFALSLPLVQEILKKKGWRY